MESNNSKFDINKYFVQTDARDCCSNIKDTEPNKKELKCPKCGSPPGPLGLMDGGSSICSSCKNIFHYCKYFKEIRDDHRPLDDIKLL